MQDISDAVSEDRQGVIIAIEVTAGAKETVFPAGYNEWRKTLGCRVQAPAVEGRANRAILKIIAAKLCVPLSAVSVISGAASSQKRVHIAGLNRLRVLELLGRIKI